MENTWPTSHIVVRTVSLPGPVITAMAICLFSEIVMLSRQCIATGFAGAVIALKR